MEKFLDRHHAGQALAKELQAYRHQKDVIVLALPRGGVPVAYEIAKSLACPLDVFIVRKLGVPGHEELAMGAIASHDTIVFNQDIVHALMISSDLIEQVIATEKIELNRRELAYRGNKAPLQLKNKTIILVDDGIATGATMRAAITALRKLAPAKIIVAIPVASPESVEEMSILVDKIVCLLKPYDLGAVGFWYNDFTQTTDDEVFQLLRKLQ